MTSAHRLDRANMLLQSDAGAESDCVLLDIAEGKDVTEREKTLSTLVSRLYRLIHPPFCASKHEDWEIENHGV